MNVIERNQQRFWNLAEPHLGRPEVERGTMMGSECLRTGGDFFAMVDRRNGQLLVKLSAQRVAELIQEGKGEPFRPARHVFKEWLAVPAFSRKRWEQLLDEARRFVSGT